MDTLGVGEDAVKTSGLHGIFGRGGGCTTSIRCVGIPTQTGRSSAG